VQCSGVCVIDASIQDRRSKAIVLGLTALYLLAACAWQGISFYDDSVYLTLGVLFRPAAFVHAAFWGPLYVAWIKVVSLVVHDRVWCYMAQWALLVTACATVPLWFRQRWAWAFTLALVAQQFFNIGPYISLFVGTILLAGLCIVLQPRRSVTMAVFAACMACFLAALCRAEFAYAVYLCAAGTVVLALLDIRRGKAARAVAMAALACVAAVAIHYCQSHSVNDRPALALIQHFNYRAKEAGVLKADPWTSDYAERVFGVPKVDPVTGRVASLGDYYRAKPALFRGHVLANVLTLRFVFVVLALFVEVLLPWVLTRYKELRAASVYLLFVAMPDVGIMAVIYPRPHYGSILMPALVAMGLALVACHVSFAVRSAWQVVAVGAVCIAGQVALRHGRPHDWDSSLRANVALVRCLQHAEAAVGAGNGRMLNTAFPDFADVYFQQRHQRVELPLPGSTGYAVGSIPSYEVFGQWVQAEKPSWIITGPELAQSIGQQPDAFGHALQSDFGYVVWPCTARVDTRIYTHP
jgi:hypothetical protein